MNEPVASERSIYFVALIHNTAHFPYALADDLVSAALESGNYRSVKTVSMRAALHMMLAPLVGNGTGEFNANVLARPMPWEDDKNANSSKYAAAFFEASEALELAVSQEFFEYSFKAVVRRLLDDNDVKGKALLIVTDVRSRSEQALLQAGLGAKKCMLVRALGTAATRTRIACSEVDESILETFWQKVPAEEFAFMVDNTSSDAEIERLEHAVVNLAQN